MRVETKQLIRDGLLDDLQSLMINRNFCCEMYEQTGRQQYLDLVETINSKINKRKQQLGELHYGKVELD